VLGNVPGESESERLLLMLLMLLMRLLGFGERGMLALPAVLIDKRAARCDSPSLPVLKLPNMPGASGISLRFTERSWNMRTAWLCIAERYSLPVAKSSRSNVGYDDDAVASPNSGASSSNNGVGSLGTVGPP